MNRYPIWIYVIVACAMVLGFTYTLPNFFGESPAVQVSSIKATVKVDSDLLARVEAALKAANIVNQGTFLDSNSVKVRFADTDTQLKAKDVLSQSLNPERDDPSYVVALNLLSSSPNWLTAIHALPMYLGLDLRGGVHFTLQVDMNAALTKRLENLTGDIRVELRDKNLRYSGISREGNAILLSFRDADTRAKSRKVLEDNQPDLIFTEQDLGANELRLIADDQTGSDQAYAGIRAEAEHHHAAKPHQRTGRIRTGDPAGRRRPRGGGTAGRAGHGQGEGNPRPHRDP